MIQNAKAHLIYELFGTTGIANIRRPSTKHITLTLNIAVATSTRNSASANAFMYDRSSHTAQLMPKKFSRCSPGAKIDRRRPIRAERSLVGNICYGQNSVR